MDIFNENPPCMSVYKTRMVREHPEVGILADPNKGRALRELNPEGGGDPSRP